MTALLDHLWQSSLFALAVGLLTLAFRTNAARVGNRADSPIVGGPIGDENRDWRD